MKQNLTEIVMIIDESGSMTPNTKETYNSVNRFIEEQKAIPGEATFTLVFFDDRYRVIRDRVNLKDVKPLINEYVPTGMTALLDAVGKTINSIGQKLNETPEAERPSKVIFVILTDGLENASKEFTREKVKEMIKQQQDIYSWEFVFMAQNIDAFEVGNLYGFKMNNTMQSGKGEDGYKHMNFVANLAVSSYRTTGHLKVDDYSQDKDKE